MDDPEVVINQLWGAVISRLLMGEEPLSDAFALDLVANLVRGLRPGG